MRGDSNDKISDESPSTHIAVVARSNSASEETVPENGKIWAAASS